MKKYTPTLHAIERLKMRLGIDAAQASDWFNQAMKKAKYVVSQKHSGKTQLVYEYAGFYLVIDDSNHAIITIKPAASNVSSSPLTDKVTALVVRELRKAETQFKRLSRRADIELAEIGLELAQLALNKAKARSPKIQAVIEAKIDEKNAVVSEIKTRVEREADRLASLKKGADLYGVGGSE